MTDSTNYFVDYYIDIDYFSGDVEVYAVDGYAASGYVLGDSGTTTYAGDNTMGIAPPAIPAPSPAIARGVGRLGDLTFLTLPAGAELVFGATGVIDQTQTVQPTGFSAFSGPVQAIRLQHRYLTASSLGDDGAVSTGVSLKNWLTYARPSGNSLLAAGSPAVENKNKFVTPAGISTQAVGTQTIEWLKRTLSPGAISPLGFGTATLTNHTKQVFPGGGDLLNAGTTLRVEYRVRTLVTTGADTLAGGKPTLEPGDRTLQGIGAAVLALGAPTVTLSIRTLYPTALPVTWAVGAPALELKNRNLYPSGLFSQVMGGTGIDNREKYVTPGGMGSPGIGAVRIESTIRHVYPSGVSVLGTGTTWVSDSPRYVEVGEGFKTSAYGVPTLGYGRALAPAGWTDEAFGTRIVPYDQLLYGHGLLALQFGAHTVTNQNQTLTGRGFLSGTREEYRWGTAKVWNWRQYAAQYAQSEVDSGLTPPTMPDDLAIADRNRVLGVAAPGNPPGLPVPTIANNARLVKPTGVAPVAATGVLQITHRDRSFVMTGFTTLVMQKYLVVYNKARVLAPAGIASAAYGALTGVVNTRRTFRIYSYLNSLEMGTPMVAYRIRSFRLADQGIAPPTLKVGTTAVKLWRSFVAPGGFDQSGFGAAYLQIHWTIFYLSGIKAAVYGSPVVKNKTPQLYAYGRDSSVFGTTSVRTQWRRVTLDGIPSQVFGDALIKDRRLWITPNGVDKLLFGPKARIEKTTEDPPAAQTLYPGGFSMLNMEGIVNLNQQVAYVSGFSALASGAAVVASNGILVTPGAGVFGYGSPTVELFIRTLVPDSIGQSPEFDTGSFPRMTPWTIWAPKGAPDQASRILGQGGAYIDIGGDANNPGIKPGEPTITLAYRSITGPTLGSLAGAGTPGLALRRQYIKPTGYTPSRQGYQMIGPFTQTAGQWGDDTEVPDTAYGSPTVTNHYTGPQTITGSGWSSFGMGTADPELFIRTLVPRGFSALGMGNSNDETESHQYQKLHVGPPNPTIPDGWDSATFGTGWISLKIRDVRAAGFDTFACDYSVDDFDGRMKVKQKSEAIAAQTLTGSGFSRLHVATPDIKLKTQYIRPDGNSDTYRKGAPLS